MFKNFKNNILKMYLIKSTILDAIFIILLVICIIILLLTILEPTTVSIALCMFFYIPILKFIQSKYHSKLKTWKFYLCNYKYPLKKIKQLDTVSIALCMFFYIPILKFIQSKYHSKLKTWKFYLCNYKYPLKKIKQLDEEWSKTGIVCHTLISESCIFSFKNPTSIIDATKLILVCHTKCTHGESTWYSMIFYFSDGTSTELIYSSKDDIQELLFTISTLMPYIYIENPQEILKKFDNNFEELSKEVEIAKRQGIRNNYKVKANTKDCIENNSTNSKKISLKFFLGLPILLITILISCSIYFLEKILGLLLLLIVILSGIELCTNIVTCPQPITAQIARIDYFTDDTTQKCTPIYRYIVDNNVIEVKSQDNYNVDDYLGKVGNSKQLYYNPNNPFNYYDRATIPSTMWIITLMLIISIILIIAPDYI